MTITVSKEKLAEVIGFSGELLERAIGLLKDRPWDFGPEEDKFLESIRAALEGFKISLTDAQAGLGEVGEVVESASALAEAAADLVEEVEDVIEEAVEEPESEPEPEEPEVIEEPEPEEEEASDDMKELLELEAKLAALKEKVKVEGGE